MRNTSRKHFELCNEVYSDDTAAGSCKTRRYAGLRMPIWKALGRVECAYLADRPQQLRERARALHGFGGPTRRCTPDLLCAKDGCRVSAWKQLFVVFA